MVRRALMTALVAVIAFGGSLAGAHDDHNPDGPNQDPDGRPSSKRCDTYYRPGHHQGTNENNKHSHHHTNEFDNGQIGPVYVHNHTGHYVIRGDGFYLEVVGGGGYNRDGNNGGYVQGEVDLVEGAPDVDYHANVFSGTNGDMHSENVCVSVGDRKIGDQGYRPGYNPN